MADKVELRKQFKSKLREFCANNDTHRCAAQLSERLVPLLPDSGTWAAYSALTPEMDVEPVLHKTSHIHWAFPVVEGENLIFYHTDQPTNFVVNKWGIKEPHPENRTEVSLNRLDGMLIPGLAFDPKGYRLGRGKGYYDKSLMNYKGRRIGIAYSIQISAVELPREEHDEAMDMVVTEGFVITPKDVCGRER